MSHRVRHIQFYVGFINTPFTNVSPGETFSALGRIQNPTLYPTRSPQNPNPKVYLVSKQVSH